jgi:hypothetical protein
MSGKPIKNEKDYFDTIKDSEKALQYAYEMKGLVDKEYWTRATYFWTLLGATFAGYATAYLAENQTRAELVLLVISSIGLILSFAWYLVNRGSKYWLVNWERHVDILEEKITGPLYKRNHGHSEYKWYNLNQAYPFSVSRINCLISLYAFVLWGIIFAYTFCDVVTIPALTKLVLAGVTGAFIIGLFCSKVGLDNCSINFNERKIIT